MTASTGVVPAANTAMNIIACQTSPNPAAAVSAAYSKPHGSNPFSAPNTTGPWTRCVRIQIPARPRARETAFPSFGDRTAGHVTMPVAATACKTSATPANTASARPNPRCVNRTANEADDGAEGDVHRGAAAVIERGMACDSAAGNRPGGFQGLPPWDWRASRADRTSSRNVRSRPGRTRGPQAMRSWQSKVAFDVVVAAARGPLDPQLPSARRKPRRGNHDGAVGGRASAPRCGRRARPTRDRASPFRASPGAIAAGKRSRTCPAASVASTACAERVAVGDRLHVAVMSERLRVVVVAHEIDVAGHGKRHESDGAQGERRIEHGDRHSPVHTHLHTAFSGWARRARRNVIPFAAHLPCSC